MRMHYMPTVAEIISRPLFPSRPEVVGSGKQWIEQKRLSSTRGDGKLPVINSLLRDLSEDIGHGTIERQQYQARHAVSARVFDRSD